MKKTARPRKMPKKKNNNVIESLD